MKNIVEILREFCRNQISNSVCALPSNMCPPRNLNTNFAHEEAKENFTDLKNGVQESVCLWPIKAVAEQPMYHNCASLCSLCERKEEAKTIYTSFVFMN